MKARVSLRGGAVSGIDGGLERSSTTWLVEARFLVCTTAAVRVNIKACHILCNTVFAENRWMSEFTFAAQRRLQEVVEAPQEAEVVAPGGPMAAAAGAAGEEGPTLQVGQGHVYRTVPRASIATCHSHAQGPSWPGQAFGNSISEKAWHCVQHMMRHHMARHTVAQAA